jgi:hypothetical protein
MISQRSTLRSKIGIERKNSALIDMVRLMLLEYNVSNSVWAEVINIACHA